MKLIMENWRKYLAETPQSPTVSDEAQKKALQDFITAVAALGLTASAVAAEEENVALQMQETDQIEEARPGAKSRARRKRNQMRTRIKKLAGLAGVSMAEIAGDANNSVKYADAQRKMREQPHLADQITVEVGTGDLLKVPGISHLVKLGGMPLRVALAGLLGDACAAEGLTLHCLASAFQTGY